jgi:hypothetical protein
MENTYYWQHRRYARKVNSQPDEDLMSINDNLPSSSPSGNTMLKLLAAVLALVVLVALYYNTIGF